MESKQIGYPEGEQTQGPDGTTLVTDSAGFEYELPQKWNINNAYKFANADLDQITRGADPGNAGVTEQMKSYVPEEVHMTT